MEKLDDILNEEPATTEAPAEEPKQEPIATEPRIEVTQPRIRDEHGRFAKQEETGVDEQKPAREIIAEQRAKLEVGAPPASDQLPQAEFAALKDERRKRQEAERRLEAIEAQLQLQKPPAAPPPSFWDDPDAAMAHMRQEMRTELLQALKQEQQIERMDASENAAKAKYQDYPEAFVAFQQAVQYNPRLAQELATAPDPGEYAYSKGKAALALEQYGSIDDLLAAERQKWEAEVKGAIPTLTPNLPSTTAADGSVGARTGPGWSGPQPLKEIIG